MKEQIKHHRHHTFIEKPFSPKHFRDPGHLVEFACSREDGQTQEEFYHDTTERPHVDRARIGKAEQYFWRSIEPGLDVRVYSLTFMTRRTEIDNLDLWRVQAKNVV